MKQLVMASLVGLVTLAGVGVDLPQVRAAGYPAYYSGRRYGNGYAYRMYYYYSKANGQYRHHVAVYHPSYPRYVYYYNPYKRKYWGRYDLVAGGYSKLAEADQKPTLGETPESAFPKAGRMPAAEPGDEEPMLPPPEANLGRAPGMPSLPYVPPPQAAGGCHYPR